MRKGLHSLLQKRRAYLAGRSTVYTEKLGHRAERQPRYFLLAGRQEKTVSFPRRHRRYLHHHAFRPFKCRTAFTLDNPAFCADMDARHVIYTSNSNPILNELLNMIVKIDEKQPVRDIRDFFIPHIETSVSRACSDTTDS